MSHPADIAARTQRFNEAARTFTPPAPTRHAKLMPMKDGIIELRQKGASLRLIRELLATVDVAVGMDTIARFLAEVNGETAPQRSSKRSGRRRVGIPKLTNRQPNAAPAVPEHPPRLYRDALSRDRNVHAHPDHASPIRATSESVSLYMNKQINLVINGKGGVITGGWLTATQRAVFD